MTIIFKGLPLEVDYVYYKAVRGLRDSTGAQLEEDTPAQVDILSVKLGEWDIIELIRPSIGIIERLVLEEMEG